MWILVIVTNFSNLLSIIGAISLESEGSSAILIIIEVLWTVAAPTSVVWLELGADLILQLWWLDKNDVTNAISHRWLKIKLCF